MKLLIRTKFFHISLAYLNEGISSMFDLAMYINTLLDDDGKGVIRDYHKLDVVSFMKQYLLDGRKALERVKASADTAVNGSLPVANIRKAVKETIHFRKGSGEHVNKTK
ncbi:hypothetical protein [Roseburia sp. 1XD42-34]|uniref:hypothetical protein n=2 Tax=Clostridia TaxID=186801 RepID=UPI0011C22330|nr:hypothetical protein [Roseburia sp. 1XD42-34]